MPELILPDGYQRDANGSVSGFGIAGRLLASGMDVSQLRTNDVLRKDEWEHFDAVLVEIARANLVAVADLFAAGLTFDLPNAMGTTILEWEDVSDMEPAEISMSGVTPGQNDRVIYRTNSLPIPIVHKDFFINVRALNASRKLGQTLDTTQLEVSTRKVAEFNETVLFNGATVVHGGASIFGYTTATNRNTGSLTGDWALIAQTGEIILADTIAMVAAAKADFMFGPFQMYVPTDYDTKLDEDFKANSDKTIRERLLQLNKISSIKESTDLTGAGAGEVLLVQMTRDVVDMVDGMQPTNLQWETHGGMVFNFKVMSIMVPRIKNDQELRSGIVHFTV